MALTDTQKNMLLTLERMQVFKAQQDAANTEKFVAKETDKSLMTSDEHSKLKDVEAGAQVNVLEGVKVNGEALTANDKVVDVTVTEGTTDGSILVNGKAVAVHGAAATMAAVSTLVGTDTSKSARTIANEELAKQMIPENAKESLDTLQEIAAWIQSHPDDASAMNADISMFKAGLADFIKAGEGEGAHDVMDNVKSYIDTENGKKVDKADGKSLIDDTEIARLKEMSDDANKTEVSAEYTAGLKVATVTIDGTATDVYLPIASEDDVKALFA